MGFSSTYAQFFPPAPTWGVGDIPDLTGRVAIVTGGYGGIGKETAKALLEKKAKVYIAGRSKEKAIQAIHELKTETGHEAIFLQLDLGDLKAIKAAVSEFLSKETQLHILFNNGGVMRPPVDQITVDGLDLQFGTNVVGHFHLTTLLLPLLLESVGASPDSHVRVVNTSSFSSELVNGIDFDLIRDGPSRRSKSPSTLYSQSKLGNVIFSDELARRYGNRGLISISLNPGNLRTDLGRHLGRVQLAFIGLLLYPPSMGALTQLWAGTSPEALQANGKYLVPWAREGEGNPIAKDPELGAKLWTWLEDEVKSI